MEIYLDNSATTKPYAEVVEEMVKALNTEYGNPSFSKSLSVLNTEGCSIVVDII